MENMQQPHPAIARELLDHAREAFQKLPALGAIAWLFGRMPGKQHLFLKDLDWAVLPPLILDQCRLFMNKEMPFSYISWASVNDEVHARLMSGNMKLQPHEWKQGDHLWLIDIVAPFGEADRMVAELKQSTFPAKDVHCSSTGEDGKSKTMKTF